MQNVNKLTTSFIKITDAIDKARNQDEYNIYASMLDEEELECLKYAQRLRRYAYRQLQTAPEAPPPTDTDESKPALNKGREKKFVQGQVIEVDIEPTSPDDTPLSFFSYCDASQYDNDVRLFRTSR